MNEPQKTGFVVSEMSSFCVAEVCSAEAKAQHEASRRVFVGSRTPYSENFKTQVLHDYFQSQQSITACAKKWRITPDTLCRWVHACNPSGSQKQQKELCTNQLDSSSVVQPTSACSPAEKSLPLHPKSASMDASEQALNNLRQENERLRRSVEYERLRVAAYERLLEIVKQEDGIDLLKKDGAKQ